MAGTFFPSRKAVNWVNLSSQHCLMSSGETRKKLVPMQWTIFALPIFPNEDEEEEDPLLSPRAGKNDCATKHLGS